MKKSGLIVLNIAIIFVLIFAGRGETIQAFAYEAGPGVETTETPGAENEYFSVETITSADGKQLERYVISGPPHPPAGYELERAAVSLIQKDQPMAIRSLTVPAYDWVFGCSAVSGAMIAAYYDRNGSPNIYTGPANGGVMPLDNSVWPIWLDGTGYPYPSNPLVASKAGIDGSSRGSIDDYWVAYDSDEPDPYLTYGWSEHAWGSAISDFMKTSQSVYGNWDGSTTFYTYRDIYSLYPLTCSDMVAYDIASVDGTYGRKLFYEARGYTVTDCYNQKTDNNAGGFTFAKYKTEIDAGRPVLLNLVGHSIVGVGYDDASNTIYIHDTWDDNLHSMPWGGFYAGMELLSVSIVNIVNIVNTVALLPGAFDTSSPADGAVGVPTDPTFSWGSSSGATSYEYCLTASAGCPEPWPTVGSSTSVSASGLSKEETYYWHVRARNATGITFADDGAWKSFTTIAALPTITSISPPSGPVGTEVSILGTNFSGATEVRFNGVGASFDVQSATEIHATVPAGAASGKISVVTPGGTASSSADFSVDNFVQFSAPTCTAGESDGAASILVMLNEASSQTVTVNYATSDGTATAGEDYDAASGSITFKPGDSEMNILISILADTIHEEDETFTLTLADPVNASLPVPAEIDCLIIDDDPRVWNIHLPFLVN